MEIDLFVISGSVFILLIIFSSAFIIVSAQRKKTQILLDLRNLELKRQKDISINTLETQEKERQQIGMELHDELGPSFAAIRLNLARVQQKIKSDKPEEVEDIIAQTSSDLKEAISQFSDVSRLLYPVILMRHGLESALKDLIDKYNQTSDIRFNFSFNTKGAKSELANLVLYRICQELTTNALKHSEAKNASLTILDDSGKILLNYEDDGIGFDTSREHQGLGLNSIRGRVQAVDGSVEFDSKPNKGLTISISIPND